MANITKWLEKNSLIINGKKGTTEAILFGTAKRSHYKMDLKVRMNDCLIQFVSGCKYLGVFFDPSLNMKEHLKKDLKKCGRTN